MKTIEVLVPEAEVKFREIRMSERTKELNGRVIGFLWNNKPSGDLLLKKIENLLKEKFELSYTLMKRKTKASSKTPDDMLEELSIKCDLVILAIGDWGSCVSWCIHDAVELEKRGTSTVTVCTDEFEYLGSMESKALQMPNLCIVTVPHPLGGLKSGEIDKKAEIAFQKIVKFIEKKG